MSFEEAAKKIKELPKEVTDTFSDEKKLEIYSLYKQATCGDCNIPQPGITEVVAKAKWDAWNASKGISQDEAKEKYIEIANELLE